MVGRQARSALFNEPKRWVVRAAHGWLAWPKPTIPVRRPMVNTEFIFSYETEKSRKYFFEYTWYRTACQSLFVSFLIICCLQDPTFIPLDFIWFESLFKTVTFWSSYWQVFFKSKKNFFYNNCSTIPYTFPRRIICAKIRITSFS